MILFVYLSIKLLTYFLSGQGRSWIYLGSLHVGRTYPIPTQDSMIQSSSQLESVSLAKSLTPVRLSWFLYSYGEHYYSCAFP